jgi:hypothetical protein
LYAFNINLNAYRNQIDAFTVENKYPTTNTFQQTNKIFRKHKIEQYVSFSKIRFTINNNLFSTRYNSTRKKIKSRFSLDMGLKAIQKEGELFF